MADRFRVLLVDDGELDDVRDSLLSLGAEFAHLRGGAVPARLDAPRDLFVATTRRANLAKPWPRAERPVRIAVVTEDSSTLRATLRRLGFTYLVRRPAHPIALRLLLLHALYQGQERRGAPRVPLGYPVAVKVGVRRRDALLVDLAENGCRFLTHEPVATGSKVTVQVPSELCGDDGFALPGKVVRCVTDRSSPSDGTHSVAIQFSTLTEAARSLLEEALSAHRLGEGSGDEAFVAPLVTPTDIGDEQAPRLVRRVAPPPLPAPPKLRSSAPGPNAKRGRPQDRRRHTRRRFGERVVAAATDGSIHRVLIGRDLSTGGMRVDRQPELVVGARLRLALYDATRDTPVVVTANVVRDDGTGGVALRFEDLGAEAAARLEQLVAGLPPVERLSDGETGAMGTVVGEILK
jgi:hypothetical protein